MVDTTSASAAPAAASPKKGKGAAKVGSKTAKPKGEKKPAATHPTTAVMVVEAITKLNEKSGSSLHAIKKYIAEAYKVDVERQGSFIRKALKRLVETGKLTKPKGTGATGSFKLASKTTAAAAKADKPKVVKKAKVSSSPKPRKPAPKKPAAKTAPAPKKEKPAAAVAKEATKPKATSPKRAPAKPAAQPKPAVAPAEKKVKKAPAKAKSPKVKLPKTMGKKPAAKPKTAAPKKPAPKKK